MRALQGWWKATPPPRAWAASQPSNGAGVAIDAEEVPNKEQMLRALAARTPDSSPDLGYGGWKAEDGAVEAQSVVTEAAAEPPASSMAPEDTIAPGENTASVAATAEAMEAQPPDARPMIAYGSTGPYVTLAQERLNAHGAFVDEALAVDGAFGPLTLKATKRFQGEHALTVDGIIGPKTWGALDGPVKVGGNGANALPGSGVGRGRLAYDNTSWTLSPPPPDLTRDRAIELVEARQEPATGDPQLGPKVMVSNDDATVHTHLLWYVAQLGNRSQWGTETDLVVYIGAAAPGIQAPEGLVTVRIDGAGNVDARLVSRKGRPTGPGFKDVPEGIARLMKDFAFAEVKVNGKTWTEEELGKVHASLSAASASELVALKGAVLLRVATLTEGAAGFYKRHDKDEGGRASLSLSDKAFVVDDVGFVGSGAAPLPRSSMTILHELGHAVEEHTLRLAEDEVNDAIASFHGAVQTANEAIGKQHEANAKSNRSLPNLNKLSREERNYVNATRSAARKLVAYANNRDPNQWATVRDASEKSLQDRDTGADKVPETSKARSAMHELHGAEDKLFESAKDVENTDVRVSASKQKLTATNGKKQPTAQLDRFEAKFGTLAKQEPITGYAGSKGIGEFYAEAFALWRADPEYLKGEYPEVHGWFAAGEHLK